MSSKSKKGRVQNSFERQRRLKKQELLEENPDPFYSPSIETRNNHIKKSKNKKRKILTLDDKLSRKYSNKSNNNYNNSFNNNNYNNKRRRMSANYSITSNSSSDIEILNNTNNSYNNNSYHAPKYLNKSSKKKNNKSPTKMTYNIYANAMMTDNNINSINNTNSANSSGDFGPISPLPFHQEIIRSKIDNNNNNNNIFNDLNDTMTVKSYRSSLKSRNISYNSQDDDSYKSSYHSTVSRRSKSRSTSPHNSQSSLGQMNEAQDQIAKLQLQKNKNKNRNKNNYNDSIAFRHAVNDAYKQKSKQKVGKSSLSRLQISNNNNNYRNGGKHRKKNNKNKKRKNITRKYLNLRSSTLNDLPIGMSRDDGILITDLNKQNYKDLMEIGNKRIKNVKNDFGDFGAEFIKETQDRASKKNNEKIQIDLTMDDNDNDDDMSIEILNNNKIEMDNIIEEDNDIQILSNNNQRQRKIFKSFKLLNKSKQQRIATLKQLRKSPGRNIKSQFIPFNIKLFSKRKLINNIYSLSIKRARIESYKKFNRNISNDVYKTVKYEQDFDANKPFIKKIMKNIEIYLKRKQEQRILKEEEKRQQQLLLFEKEKEKDKKQINQSQVIRNKKLEALEEEDHTLINQIVELPLNKVVGKHNRSNLEVTVKDILTLEPGQWLNDEVMNFYMSLLQDRNLKRRQNNKKYVRALFMNTFFFTKLSSNSYNYKSVKRWTKKAKLVKKGCLNLNNIFELDKFIFPVHVNSIHWCCGCINFSMKKFEYYDSMNGSSSDFFRIIRKYLEDEWKDKLKCDKNKYDLNLNEWKEDNNIGKYPQQENGVDCGVFTSKCADWISDDLYPDYSQQNMSYFRERMMVEIVQGKTLDF